MYRILLLSVLQSQCTVQLRCLWETFVWLFCVSHNATWSVVLYFCKPKFVTLLLLLLLLLFTPQSHRPTPAPSQLNLSLSNSSSWTLYLSATSIMSSSTHRICSLQLPNLSLNLSEPQNIFNCFQRNFISVACVFVTFCWFLRTPHSLTNQRTNSMEHSPSWKLTVSLILKKFPAMNITWKFINSFPALSQILLLPDQFKYYSVPRAMHAHYLHLPNLMSNSHSFHRSKRSVAVWEYMKYSVTQ